MDIYVDRKQKRRLFNLYKACAFLNNFTGFFPIVEQISTKKLFHVLQKGLMLTSLNMSGYTKLSIDVPMLCASLKSLPLLAYLNLRECMLGDAEAKPILDTLATSDSLLTLDLSYNNIEHGEILRGFLEKNKSLQKLSLASNKLGLASIKDLGLALCTNNTLSMIDLSDNRIGEKASHIFAALRINTGLIHVNLGGNNLKSVEVQVAEVVKMNGRLLYLDLYKNELDFESIKELVKALTFNHTILCVDLRYSEGLTQSQISEIRKIAGSNSQRLLLDVSDTRAFTNYLNFIDTNKYI